MSNQEDNDLSLHLCFLTYDHHLDFEDTNRSRSRTPTRREGEVWIPSSVDLRINQMRNFGDNNV